MSTISNRFYVTALEDGMTLHGNLAVDGSVTQGWNGSSAVPDWTVPENQPTIYLTLLAGAQNVQPASGYKWYYNGSEITWNGSTSTDGRFEKTTKSLTPVGGGTAIQMPAIKIIANLATSVNVDIDTITFKGQYVQANSGIDFTADIQIRISDIKGNGYLGTLSFVNGVADITQKEEVITMYASLYGGDGGGLVSGYTTQWYVNDIHYDPSDTAHFTPNKTKTRTVTIGAQTYPGLDLYEGDVTDHTVIRCDFYIGADLKYSAYVGVDDMQDPEFMYIQYNGNNGNAASLRKSETATFQIWVGLRDDPTVIGGTSTPYYNLIKVKLLDGDGSVIMATGLQTNIPNPDSEGYRTLPMSSGKAAISVHYNTVNEAGKKNLTGIVLATHST